LGAKLLQRTTRHVRLTEAGSNYLPNARSILSAISDAESSILDAQTELKGPIVVTAPATLGRLHIAPLTVQFAASRPLVRFTTLFLDRLIDLVDEGVDVAVRIAHLPDSSTTAVRVGWVRRVLCAAPLFLAKHGEPGSPIELAKLDAIDLLPSQLPWSFGPTQQSRAIRPPVRFSANSVDTAIAAAAAGCGVVRLLSYQASEFIRSGALVRIMPHCEPDPVPIHIMFADGRAAPKRVRAYVTHLVDALRANSNLQL
jgi:DNA-binding transcriptional LysR family regulator